MLDRKSWPDKNLLITLVMVGVLMFVPVVSIVSYIRLVSTISQSEDLARQQQAGIELATLLDAFSIGQARLLRLANNLLILKDLELMDGDAITRMREQADLMHGLMKKIDELKQRQLGDLGDKLFPAGWLEPSEPGIPFESLRKNLDLFVMNCTVEVPALLAERRSTMIAYADEFAALDSFLTSQRSDLYNQIFSDLLPQELEAEVYKNLILRWNKLDRLLSEAVLQRKADYLDQNLVQSLQGTEVWDFPGLSRAGRGSAIKDRINSMRQFFRQRYLVTLNQWLGQKARLELEFTRLDNQINNYSNQLSLGLNQFSKEIKAILDVRFASASRVQQDLRQNLVINGVLTVSVALLMALAVLYYLRQLARTNAELSREVLLRTRELETSNLDLGSKLEELKRTRDHLIRNEKFAALGGLVAGVAHEINTPLGVAVTAASYQEEKIRSILTHDVSVMGPEYLQELGTIQKATELVLRNLGRAAELVRSFKQVSVDQSHDETREFDLGAYMDELVLSLSPLFRNKPVQIQQMIPHGIMMNTLAGSLSQIVSNLILNANIHAFDPDQEGLIRLEAEVPSDPEKVLLRVTDNGRGIPPELHQKIFDPFFTTRRSQGGTGLGLFIVYNLACSRLGGSIELESVLGKGSSFLLVIPRMHREENFK